MTTVNDLERRCTQLNQEFQRGALSEEEFRTGMNSLRFQDAQNRWWMIGAQSRKWYFFDGTRWIPGAPPPIPTLHPVAPIEPSPAPSAEVTAYTGPTVPAERAVEPEPLQAAVETNPLAVETAPITRRRRSRGFVSLRLALTSALVAAILLLGAFLFAVENLVPGKPISALFTRAFGSAPTAQGSAANPSGLTPGVLAVINAGDQALAQGQIDPAIAQYLRAGQAAPSSALPLTRLTRAYALKGQMTDAVTRGRQAVRLAPNDADAHAQLCRALLWDKQLDEAIKSCEGAIKLDSQNAPAHAFLAEALLHAHRAGDAQPRATLAVQLAPQNAEAHRAQAWVLTLRGDKSAALGAWNRTLALEPNLFFRHYEAGEVQRVFFNSPQNALPLYEKSLALYNAYLPAIIRLGITYLDVNQPENAIPHLRRATTLSPSNVQVIASLGLAYARTNECTQAIPYFEQALKMDVNNSVAQRGLVQCKTGQAPSPSPAPPAQTVPLIPPTVVPGQ